MVFYGIVFFRFDHANQSITLLEFSQPCPKQNLVQFKVVSRYIPKKIDDSVIEDNVTVSSSQFSRNNGTVRVSTLFDIVF